MARPQADLSLIAFLNTDPIALHPAAAGGRASARCDGRSALRGSRREDEEKNVGLLGLPSLISIGWARIGASRGLKRNRC
eukprot:4215127-Pyramimonas_sp.AAC.1